MMSFTEKASCARVTAEGAFLLSSPGFPVFLLFLHGPVFLPVFALDLPAASQKYHIHFHIFPSNSAWGGEKGKS